MSHSERTVRQRQGNGAEGTTRIHFTKEALEEYKPGETPYYVWDEDERGLGLLVLPSGVRTFYFRFRAAGQSRRLQLGRFPGLTVPAARRKAQSARGELADGKDPSEETRERRAEMNLGELLAKYAEDHLKPNRKPGAAEAAAQLTRDYLAPLVAFKLSDVTRRRVAEWHVRASEKSRVRTNRALSLLSAACSFAIVRDLAPARWVGVNPCHGVKANREESRERFLHPAELGRLLQAIEAEPVDHQDFFKLLLYTGARRANVQAMKWADLDLEKGAWRIPAAESKSGTAMNIPLVGEALAILLRRQTERDNLLEHAATTVHADASRWTFRDVRLRAIERRKAEQGATFVFPGWGRTGHFVEPQIPWRRVLKRAKIADLRLHDLRRTMGSWLAGQGANAFVIGKALGHKSLAATAVYARLDLDPVRAAIQAVSTAFVKAGVEAEADEKKVVEMKPTRKARR
jgi:integrase